MESKPSKWKKVLRWLPGVLISIIALYAVFQFIDLEDLSNAFQTVSWKFIVLVICVNVLGIATRGKAWQVILGKNVTYKQAFFGINEGYFLNNILPFRAGEIGRSFFVGRSSGLGTFYVLSTIVIERSFDVAFAGALVVLTLSHLVGKDMSWIQPVATIALILVIAALLVLFLVARNKEKVLAWVHKLQKPEKLMKFLLPKVDSIVEGFSLLANPTQFIKSLLWIGLCWGVWSLGYYIPVATIIPGAPFWWGIFVAGVLALGVAIPSAPSALGVFEASFVGAIAILGGDSSTAMAYALILHITQFFSSAVFGMWGLFREGLSISEMFKFTAPQGDAGAAVTEKEEA